MSRILFASATALAATLAFGSTAGAAELPKSTQKVLTELKIDPSLMDGLDEELNVPQAWIDGAAKEGQVTILGTWPNKQFRVMSAPFIERYPNVKLNYNRSGTAARGMKVVIALREGRVAADVVTSMVDAILQFQELNAFADLRDLPAVKNIPTEYSAPDGTWVSHKISYRCIGFNSNNIKKSEMPRTWDDLLTTDALKNGKMAVTNHPNSWLLGLWEIKGDEWGENFTKRLFEEMKPVLRKEGMSAATALTVAGEFTANLPAPEWQVQRYQDKGAPVGVHCPEPAPITLSPIAMLEKSPNKNGAKLFVNWVLSREGQLLQYYDSYVIPVHTALDQPRFNSVHDQVKGKKQSIRDDAKLGNETHKKMLKLWSSYYTGSADGGSE